MTSAFPDKVRLLNGSGTRYQYKAGTGGVLDHSIHGIYLRRDLLRQSIRVELIIERLASHWRVAFRGRAALAGLSRFDDEESAWRAAEAWVDAYEAVLRMGGEPSPQEWDAQRAQALHAAGEPL